MSGQSRLKVVRLTNLSLPRKREFTQPCNRNANNGHKALDSGFRRNDGVAAGMTGVSNPPIRGERRGLLFVGGGWRAGFKPAPTGLGTGILVRRRRLGAGFKPAPTGLGTGILVRRRRLEGGFQTRPYGAGNGDSCSPEEVGGRVSNPPLRGDRLQGLAGVAGGDDGVPVPAHGDHLHLAPGLGLVAVVGAAGVAGAA